jgi:hypothetical protein
MSEAVTTVQPARPRPERVVMPTEIEYPPEDDEPMAETGAHGTQITLLSEQLKALFDDDPHTCVATDVFIRGNSQ